ncbi:MAG: hypothetical protein LBB43_03195 [Spirochaetaceae bacterium]|nr:hypothetical protein [Spirochaetaceae bacterium]
MAESTASLGEEYFISRRRVPHLSEKSTASLGGEYRISRLRVLHLLEKSTASLGKFASSSGVAKNGDRTIIAVFSFYDWMFCSHSVIANTRTLFKSRIK